MNSYYFKIVEIDQGFCKIVYEVETSSGVKVNYCLLDQAKDCPVELHFCSGSPWYEPDFQTKLKKDIKVKFEMPQGNTELETKVKQWIIANNYN